MLGYFKTTLMLIVPLTFPLDYLYPYETSYTSTSVTKLMHRLMQLADQPLSEENRIFLLECVKDIQANSVAYRVSPHIEFLNLLTRHIPKTPDQRELLEICSALYLAQRRVGDPINVSQHVTKDDSDLPQATKEIIANLCKTADGLLIMLSKMPEMQERISELEEIGNKNSKDDILEKIEYEKTLLETIVQAKTTLNEAFENLRADYKLRKNELMDSYRKKLDSIITEQRGAFVDNQDDTEVKTKVDEEIDIDSEGNEADECAIDDSASHT